MRKRLLVISLVIVLTLSLSIMLLPAGLAMAATVFNVPSAGYPTIQSAIDAASAGDTVQVAADTYYENITLKDGVQVLGAGVGVTTIDGGGNSSVVTAIGVGPGTNLEGFTITNGTGTYGAYPSRLCGGGMCNYNSSPTVVNCIFSGNSADYGGGMCNYQYSSPVVTNCTFCGNSADCGGGMRNLYYSSPMVTNCIFSNNWGGNGGGMNNFTSSPMVTNCTFLDNNSNGGGGMFNTDYSSPMVTNCIFKGNSSPQGCGGGGMGNMTSSPTVTNCIFYGNSSYDGGGMWNDYSSPTVTNCTFSGNSAGDGGGMYNCYNSLPTVVNCILWGDSPQEIYNDSSAPVVTYSDIQGGYGGDGNIDIDPLFVNPLVDDYHLQPGSPCIDVGYNAAPYLPSTDFEGDPRIVDGVVDMGVDEYYVPVVATTTDVMGSIIAPSITLDPPDDFSFNNPLKVGVNEANSGATGSVSVTVGSANGGNWQVTAASHPDYAGKMYSGGTDLTDMMWIATVEGWKYADTGDSYTGTFDGGGICTPSTLTLYAHQNVLNTDPAGTYTIIIVYTASITSYN